MRTTTNQNTKGEKSEGDNTVDFLTNMILPMPREIRSTKP